MEDQAVYVEEDRAVFRQDGVSLLFPFVACGDGY